MTENSDYSEFFEHQNIPEGLRPIQNFDLGKYLGTWYDIAHFDFQSEPHDMSNVFLNYSQNLDGTVKVVNSGFLETKNEWISKEGKAKFRGKENEGALKVSFDGIDWADYNIMEVDEDYQYALVFGRNTDLMWMLSRERGMPQKIKDKYSELAKLAGYDLGKIHWTDQTKQIPVF